MKPFFIFFLFLVCGHFSFGQTSKHRPDSIWFAELKLKKVKLGCETSASTNASLPIKNIKCIDVRLDTSCIFVDARYDRISLSPNVSAALENCLNSASEIKLQDTTGQIVCFIKFLKISVHDSVTKTASLYNAVFKIRYEVEGYYKHENKYYPAFRVDSMFYIPKKKVDKMLDILEPFLTSVNTKCSRLSKDRLLKKKSYSENEVFEMYNERYKNASFKVPKRGLYNNLDELKKNLPAYIDFEIKLRMNTQVVTVPKDSLFHVRKIMFYSDGQKLWINTIDGFCPLLASGNRYEYYGYYSNRYQTPLANVNSDPRLNANPAINSDGSITNIIGLMGPGQGRPQKRIHFLDIETGEIY